jgi:hypothetical protein
MFQIKAALLASFDIKSSVMEQRAIMKRRRLGGAVILVQSDSELVVKVIPRRPNSFRFGW